MYQDKVVVCRTFLPVALADTDMAENILPENENINMKDAIHTTSIENDGLENILSGERHFDGIGRINKVNPKRKWYRPSSEVGMVCP